MGYNKEISPFEKQAHVSRLLGTPAQNKGGDTEPLLRQTARFLVAQCSLAERGELAA